MQALFTMGRTDALNAIQQGQGTTMEDFVQFYKDDVRNNFGKDISTKEHANTFDIKEELSVIQQKLEEHL